MTNESAKELVITSMKALFERDKLIYFRNVTLLDRLFDFHVLIPNKDSTYRSLFILVTPTGSFKNNEYDILAWKVAEMKFYLWVWNFTKFETCSLLPNYYKLINEKLNKENSKNTTDYTLFC